MSRGVLVIIGCHLSAVDKPSSASASISLLPQVDTSQTDTDTDLARVLRGTSPTQPTQLSERSRLGASKKPTRNAESAAQTGDGLSFCSARLGAFALQCGAVQTAAVATTHDHTITTTIRQRYLEYLLRDCFSFSSVPYELVSARTFQRREEA